MKFFFHYNRPKSLKDKVPTITLHFKDRCHFINDLKINNVITYPRFRKNQPRFVMCGEAKRIRIKNKVATIE